MWLRATMEDLLCKTEEEHASSDKETCYEWLQDPGLYVSDSAAQPQGFWAPEPVPAPTEC